MFDLAPFLEAISKAEAPTRPKIADWQRDAARAMFHNTCAFCTRPLNLASHRSWMLVALVPLELGGPPHVSDNWVPSCRRCAGKKALPDVAGWPSWRASADTDRVALLLERRQAVLLQAENHFTPLSRHTKRKQVQAHLASRFEKRRFRVHAWSGDVDGKRVCLVGWGSRAGDDLALSEVLLALRLRDGAEVLAAGRIHLLRLPTDGFLGAVWGLIETHGIVVPLDLIGNAALDTDDWRECWRHRACGLRRNHQRVTMIGAPPLPYAPRTLSNNPDSIRRLVQLQASKRRANLAESERCYRAAMAQKSEYLDKVRRRTEVPMPVSIYISWSSGVRRLGLDWAGRERQEREAASTQPTAPE